MYIVDSIIKYADMLGHKKGIQRFKKTNPTLPTNTQPFLKSRTNMRNNPNQHLDDSNNSKSFLSSHNYERIETNETLPQIKNDHDLFNDNEQSSKLMNTVSKQSFDT